MIGRLQGTLVSKNVEGVVIDVHGVGYEVAVPPRTIAELPAVGEDAVLYTHLHVREDRLALFGFAAIDQRDLFKVLLGISGVGPGVALAILAAMTPDQLRHIVLAEDTAGLTAVPGIGKRSAQKLILDLRPKMDIPDAELAKFGSSLAEARLALEGLGYSGEEIRRVIGGLSKDEPVEVLVRRALQALGKS